jgi:ubiquinone/menaquinone biosynthesis C-methylase UbiE
LDALPATQNQSEGNLNTVTLGDEREKIELSQQRWRGDEADEGLTWGVRMSGDAFAAFLLAHAPTDQDATIVEIGPGYGRITESVLRHNIPFKRYVGFDISEARVRRLREHFGDSRMTFVHSDILQTADMDGLASLTFASAVFEHLYPDFGAAVASISRFTKPSGFLVVDLCRADELLTHKEAGFEPGGTYVRTYAIEEVQRLFRENGFILQQIDAISFGNDVNGREIRRTTVCARKTA